MPIFGSKVQDTLGKQYIVKKAFTTRGFYGINKKGTLRVTTKCLLPNMILSVEGPNNNSAKIKQLAGLKKNEIFAIARTNRDDASPELKKLVPSNPQAAIKRFLEECIIHWKTIVLSEKDFANLKEIPIAEYRRIRNIGPKAYYPNLKA